MLAHERLPINDQRHRILEIRAEREYRAIGGNRRDGRGRVASSATEHHGARGTASHDRVLDPACDRPLAHEEGVGDAGESLRRVLVLVGDRLARAVGARHDQHVWRTGAEQEMVKRRVGEHDAELPVVGRHVRKRDARGRDHDGRRRRSEQLFRLGRELDQASRGREVTRHQGKWLLFPELPHPQRRNGRRVSRVAGEVISADALHGEDRPGSKKVRSGANGIVARSPSSPSSPSSSVQANNRGHRRRTRPAERGSVGSPGRGTRGHIPRPSPMRPSWSRRGRRGAGG